MNKQAEHDQMLAVARAKDRIKHEMLQEMDRMNGKGENTPIDLLKW